MGIIILPFLLGSLFLAASSLSKLIKHFRIKQVGIKEFLFAFALSATLFGLVCLSYIIQGTAWALSPPFRVPIFMVFIPYLLHILIENSKKPKFISLSIIILISVVLSAIFGIVFYEIVFGLLDFLGVGKHY